jgi:hypothetical protein
VFSRVLFRSPFDRAPERVLAVVWGDFVRRDAVLDE